jgi:hypothetical protein
MHSCIWYFCHRFGAVDIASWRLLLFSSRGKIPKERAAPVRTSQSCAYRTDEVCSARGGSFVFVVSSLNNEADARYLYQISEVTPSMRMTEVLFNRAARIGTFLIAVAILLVHASIARAAAGNTALKIYEIAGAGALASASYPQDTIILYNPTLAPITCTTCAIQTHSGTSNTAAWTVYKLPVFTVPAGGFYAISASGLPTSGSFSNSPSANFYDYELQTIELGATPPSTQNILSSTVGAVALTNTQTALAESSSSQCGTGSQLVDFVAYGSNVSTNGATAATPASCFAGSGPAYYDGSSAYGRQLGITRRNKCIDTFDNLNDFVNLPVTYLNSTSTPVLCPSGTQLSAVISATPVNPGVGGAITFTASVVPATLPSSTGLTATLDFNTPYYGSTTMVMYEDGTHGDAVANDGTFTLATTIPSKTVNGFSYPANVTINDTLGNSYTGSTTLNIGGVAALPSVGNNSIRIVAWYGAGNLSKSEYARDTVILFNPTPAPITMNNWSLQTGGSTGAFTTVTYLLPVVTIPAGGYFALTGSGANFISSDGCVSAHCNLNYAYDYQLKTIEETAPGGKNTLSTDNDLSSTAVTVALVNNQSALGTCPTASPNLVDLLGIAALDGTSPVTCYAGSGPATYTPSTSLINGIVYSYATIRKNKCGNTFNNANDFMLGFIDFENSSTKPDPCPIGTQMVVTTTSSTPSSAGITDPFTFTATVMPATGPTSTNLAITADLSNLGLSATAQLYDDGTHGDAVAGDHTFTLATTSTAGIIGPEPGLIVTATDAQGNAARNLIAFTITPGTVTLSSPTTSGAVKAGGVLTFPITVTSHHGYSGIMNITCTGSPNTNTLGLPISTQCVSNPPELTLTTNGTGTLSLAIATGTTFSAGIVSGSLPFGLISILSIGFLTVAVWRRKYLPSAVLLALVSLLALNTTACSKDAGLGNTSAAPGVYTYTVTATDSNVSTINGSIIFTVTVQ